MRKRNILLKKRIKEGPNSRTGSESEIMPEPSSTSRTWATGAISARERAALGPTTAFLLCSRLVSSRLGSSRRSPRVGGWSRPAPGAAAQGTSKQDIRCTPPATAPLPSWWSAHFRTEPNSTRDLCSAQRRWPVPALCRSFLQLELQLSPGLERTNDEENNTETRPRQREETRQEYFPSKSGVSVVVRKRRACGVSGGGSGGVIVFIMGTGRGGVGLGGQSSTTSIAPQQQQQQQRSLHFEAQQTPVMDEFLEDMFAMPWDYNAGQGAMVMERAGTGAAMAGVEAASNINHNSNMGGSSSMAAAAQQQQKMFSMPLIQQQPRLLNNINNGSGALSGVNQAQLVSSQASQLSSQQQQQGKEFESSRILVILFSASRGRSSVTLFFQGCSLSSGCRCWTIGLLSFTV